MDTHLAGQSSVPAATKSSVANTANSATTSKSALPKSALRFIAHLHENNAQRVYSEPPTSVNTPSTSVGEYDRRYYEPAIKTENESLREGMEGSHYMEIMEMAREDLHRLAE